MNKGIAVIPVKSMRKSRLALTSFTADVSNVKHQFIGGSALSMLCCLSGRVALSCHNVAGAGHARRLSLSQRDLWRNWMREVWLDRVVHEVALPSRRGYCG